MVDSLPPVRFPGAAERTEAERSALAALHQFRQAQTASKALPIIRQGAERVLHQRFLAEIFGGVPKTLKRRTAAAPARNGGGRGA